MITLERLRELDAKATKGPWELHEEKGTDGEREVWAIVSGEQHIVTTDCGFYGPTPDTCDLIVELRNALPSIIKRLEAGERVARDLNIHLSEDVPCTSAVGSMSLAAYEEACSSGSDGAVEQSEKETCK